MVCEQCWRDACMAAYTRGGTVAEHYERLLTERKDNPCPPEPADPEKRDA